MNKENEPLSSKINNEEVTNSCSRPVKVSFCIGGATLEGLIWSLVDLHNSECNIWF